MVDIESVSFDKHIHPDGEKISLMSKMNCYLHLFGNKLKSEFLAETFVIVHYCYIFSLIIIGSVLMYGIGNGFKVEYVDLLFFACSAATQSGLSTVPLSGMTLFQQIIIYFLFLTTNIIFVHNSLTVIRIFWYKRRFNNIQQTSVNDYRLRRDNTISQLRAGILRSNLTAEGLDHNGYETHNSSKSLTDRMRYPICDATNKGSDDNSGCADSDSGMDLPLAYKPNIQNSRLTQNIEINEILNDSNIETDDCILATSNHPLKQQERRLKLKHKRVLSHESNQNEIKNKSNDKSCTKAKEVKNVQCPDDLNFDLTSTSGLNPSNVSDRLQITRTLTSTVNKVLPRQLTNLSRNKEIDIYNLNDRELLDYGIRKHGISPSWELNGKHSNRIGLTKQQRRELGGVEYQAMKLLSKVVYGYFFGIIILSAIFLVPFIEIRKNYQIKLQEDSLDRPVWWAFFTSMSAFSNTGLTLNPSSFIPFDENVYVLLVFSIIMLAGNTAFPIFLRFIIWLIRYFTRPSTMRYDSLTFLLNHSRRCFTLLFPSSATWWLTFVLIIFNLSDWILYIILDYNRSELKYLESGYRVFDGLFQAFSCRTTGFNVFNIPDLNSAIQFSYMIMMYISALPLAISIKATNVYEDQSLGIYKPEEELGSYNKPKLQYIAGHMKRQLSYDMWFLSLAVFLICIAETRRLDSEDLNFSIFGIMFEVISAYGTVGLSLGYPGTSASFSGEFNVVSKLVIMATMIKGRHRGLPSAIDRAIILSSEKIDKRDQIEAVIDSKRENADVKIEAS